MFAPNRSCNSLVSCPPEKALPILTKTEKMGSCNEFQVLKCIRKKRGSIYFNGCHNIYTYLLFDLFGGICDMYRR